jgi:hypothetical protein
MFMVSRGAKFLEKRREPYIALIVHSSFNGIDAGLHALSFSPGFNVHKLYLK